jgi:probable addiction module antidote protein
MKTKIKTTPLDLADNLKSEEDQIEFLQDALESGDAKYLVHALGIVARAKNVSALTDEAGISRAAFYKSFGEEGNPRLSTLLSVVRGLGLKLSFDKLNLAN